MIIIREAQFTELRQFLVDRFAADAVRYLLQHFPDPSAALGGEPAVQLFVQRGIQRAEQFGVNTEGTVTALLELWLQFGESFERSPARAWANKILSHPVLPGLAKVEMIRDRHAQLTGGCVLIPF